MARTTSISSFGGCVFDSGVPKLTAPADPVLTSSRSRAAGSPPWARREAAAPGGQPFSPSPFRRRAIYGELPDDASAVTIGCQPPDDPVSSSSRFPSSAVTASGLT